jgi:ketosteroid isomerase-like protein
LVASANVELVRSIYAAWERGDYRSAEWAHPEIEYVHADGPAPGRWKGMSEMAEAARAFLDAWEAYRIEADEYRELDGDRVLVLVHWTGSGKTSGLELGRIGTKGASLFHIGDGKIARYVVYFDREHALADLELAAEPGSPGS